MASDAAPFLMFEGDARPAIEFYVDVFGGEVRALVPWPEGGPGAAGTVMTAEFAIAGRAFRCSDSPVAHGFTFTPAISIWIECDDEAELDAAFERLLEGGEALMPVGDYGFSKRFGWVKDRYGVTWQLNLSA